jgi:hypothetical protein
MKRNKRFTIGHILLFTLTTAFLAHANERILSIRTLAAEKSDMPVWYVAVGDQQFEQLEWTTTQPSTQITSRADRDLSLYSKETNQEGEPEFKVARKVTIPEAADEVLLLGWLTNKGEQAEVLAIADDYKKAKFNDWLVINRSDHTVTLRYGEGNESISLEPGETKPYRIMGERDKGGEVIAEAIIKDTKRKIYSTFWGAADKQRTLVLFFSKDDGVGLRKVIDFLPANKEED